MPGKPKGIHRATTAKKRSLEEKAKATLFGKIVDYEEYGFVESIDRLELMRKLLKFKSPTPYQVFEQPIMLRLRRAVKSRDSRFFDRCREIMERLSAVPPDATEATDPIGSSLIAILQFLTKSEGISKITSTRVTQLMNERHPKEDGGVYVEKDIRSVAKGLGLKFPISIAELKAAEEKRQSDFFEAWKAAF